MCIVPIKSHCICHSMKTTSYFQRQQQTAHYIGGDGVRTYDSLHRLFKAILPKVTFELLFDQFTIPSSLIALFIDLFPWTYDCYNSYGYVRQSPSNHITIPGRPNSGRFVRSSVRWTAVEPPPLLTVVSFLPRLTGSCSFLTPNPPF